jgi:hypothetical protein
MKQFSYFVLLKTAEMSLNIINRSRVFHPEKNTDLEDK